MTEQEIFDAVQTLPEQKRDSLAIQLMMDYLDRGAHFYNHFAKRLVAACKFPDAEEK